MKERLITRDGGSEGFDAAHVVTTGEGHTAVSQLTKCWSLQSDKDHDQFPQLSLSPTLIMQVFTATEQICLGICKR